MYLGIQGRIDGLVRRQVQQLAIGSIDTDADTGGGADGFQQALIVRVNSAPRHRVELQLDGGQAGTGLATVQVQVQAGTTGDAAARGAAQRVDADLAKVYVDGLVARSTANGGAGTTSDAASGAVISPLKLMVPSAAMALPTTRLATAAARMLFMEMDTIELPFDSESVAIFELYKSQQHSPKSRIERQRSTSQAIV